MNAEKPLVSVIVPTKNSASTLEACLKSIKRQSYPQIELIVVDNFSDDATPEIAEKYADWFFQKGPERCAQRNFGFDQSVGVYLMYIDSDMELMPEVVEQCVQLSLEEPSVGAITIHEESFGEGFWTQCKVLERSCYAGDPTIEGVRFFPRAVIDAVGGFNEQMVSAEDWDLAERIRKADYVVKDIEAIIRHNEGHIRVWNLWMKKAYYGQHMPTFVSEGGSAGGGLGYLAERIYFFRPSLWRNWRAFVKQPITTLGMFVMLTGELVFGGYGYIRGALKNKKSDKIAA